MYNTTFKKDITEEECEAFLQKLLKKLPMTREQVIRRAVYKYYHSHFSTGTVHGKYTLKKMMWIKQHQRCYFCKKHVGKETATVEHLTPLVRGGVGNIENLALTCGFCNCLKGNMTEQEFIEFRKNPLQCNPS